MAFDTKIYLAYKTGDDLLGDGSKSNPYKTYEGSNAKTLVETDGNFQVYDLIFLEDTSENIILDFRNQTGTNYDPYVKMTFLNGSYANGSGEFIAIYNATNKSYGVWIYGLMNSGAYSKIFSQKNQYGNNTLFDTCVIKNTIIDPIRAGKYCFINTCLENVQFDCAMANVSNQFNLHLVKGCTFINVTTTQVDKEYIVLNPVNGDFGNVLGMHEQIKDNIFKNTNIVYRIDGSPTFVPPDNNNYEDCNFGFYDGNSTAIIPIPLISELITCNSITELQSLYDSVFGGSTELFDGETFLPSNLDNYLFPTDKSLYINSLHRGAYNYSITTYSIDFTAIQNGLVTSSYLERSSTGLNAVFESDFLEFPETEYPYKIVIHYTDSSSTGGEIANPSALTNERKIGLELMYSANKTASELQSNPKEYEVFYSGLQSEIFLYDKIDGKVKSYKYRITLQDEGLTPTSGTFQIEAITFETLDGVQPEINNVLLTEENLILDSDIQPIINNIILQGSIVFGNIKVINYNDETPIENVMIEVYQNSTLFYEDITDINGDSKFDYVANSDCELKIYKSGYQTKIIRFNLESLKQFNKIVTLYKQQPIFISNNSVKANLNPSYSENKYLY